MKIKFFAAAALLTGCVSYDQPEVQPAPVIAKTAPDELNKLIAEVDSEILTDDRTFQEEDLLDNAEDDAGSGDEQSAQDIPEEPAKSSNPAPVQATQSIKIPMELNSRVEEWITYFSVRDHERFQRFLNRGEKYKEQVVEILRDNGVPTELYYLAMIESGYVTEAKSHASAVGVWQFISGTGKRYGLERNNYLDERMDPLRSTMAAASYLRDLNRVFQSWYLAMAAYNAGEGRILQSIMKSNTRDFWELVKKNALPKETMAYVPKFLAAAIIGHNPTKFGFTIEKDGELPELVQVAVPSPIRLSSVSEVIGISVDKLKEYNPHLRRAITPPGTNTYDIWVPSSAADTLADSQDNLRKSTLRNSPPSVVAEDATPAVAAEFYKVRRGDSLKRIAKKYATTTANLREINGLRSNRVKVGVRLRIAANQAAELLATPQRYRVQRGDNLAKIATRFGVTIVQLKKTNRLRRSRGLRVGQLLKIAANQT